MILPEHIRAQLVRNPNLIPLRFETFNPPEIKWRGVPNVRHETLCRAFGLDVMTRFDVPESFRAEGAQRVGAGRSGARREISGFVFRNGDSEPFAKISIARDGDKFRDRDPMSRVDFERLGETV